MNLLYCLRYVNLNLLQPLNEFLAVYQRRFNLIAINPYQRTNTLTGPS